MSKKQAISFFKEIAKNNELAEKVKEVVGGQATNQAKVKELLSLAKKNHFDFTKKEAELTKDELKIALKVEDLSDVSGGRSTVMSAFMAAALLTGGLGVTGATTNVESSAMFSWLFSGGGDNGNPAAPGKKDADKDKKYQNQPPNLKLEVDWASMTKEKLIEMVLRLQSQLDQGNARIGRPSQLRTENSASPVASDISPVDSLQSEQELQRLKEENEKLKNEVTMFEKAMEKSAMTAGENIENYSRLQRENYELRQSNAKLLAASKQASKKGGGWFGFNFGSTKNDDATRIAELEEQCEALQAERDMLAEHIVSINKVGPSGVNVDLSREDVDSEDDIVAELRDRVTKDELTINKLREEKAQLEAQLNEMQNKPGCDYRAQVEGIEKKYLLIQQNTANEMKQMRNKCEAADGKVKHYDNLRLFAQLYKLRQRLALALPSFVSFKFLRNSADDKYFIKYTISEEYLRRHPGKGVRFPKIIWNDGVSEFDIHNGFVVRYSPESGREFSPSDVLLFDRTESELYDTFNPGDGTCSVDVTLGGGADRPGPVTFKHTFALGDVAASNASPADLFSDFRKECYGLGGESHFGAENPVDVASRLLTLQEVRPQSSGSPTGEKASKSSSTKEKKPQKSSSTTKKKSQDSSETNMNITDNQSEEPDMTITNNQEPTAQPTGNQRSEEALSSSAPSQETIRLENGHVVPFYRPTFSIEDLYLNRNRPLSLGEHLHTYTVDDMIQQQPLVGPDGASVVQFEVNDRSYSIDPNTGDVTWNAYFNAAYNGLQNISIPLPQLTTVNGTEPSAHFPSFVPGAQAILENMGLVGKNGQQSKQRGKFIMNVAFLDKN